MAKKLKVLFATSETHPLIKTGGLADVSGALPAALNGLDLDVRILIPGYTRVLEQMELENALKVDLLYTPGGAVRLLEGKMPGQGFPVYVVDHAGLYHRDGGPYQGAAGHEWADNALRFGTLSYVANLLSEQASPLDWQPDILHCNDWQTGLAPAYLHYSATPRARTVITIHNLAYQGVFDIKLVDSLWLPPEAVREIEGVEFHDQLSFLKAGLRFADSITTVSPTYAREIQDPFFGCGLEGLLQHRFDRLEGILNGIDTADWDPRADAHLVKNYTARTLSNGVENKRALQQELGLAQHPDVMLLGVISRLADQKGLDLFADIVPELLNDGVQICLLGSGDPVLEGRFSEFAHKHLGQFATYIGYNERLAHRMEAGIDAFIMPSRYEPCGLNQMYSMAYGTPPIVRHTGGLADSVVDAGSLENMQSDATGFVFEHADAGALLHAIRRAQAFYADLDKWHKIQRNGMACDFSWNASAAHYVELYEELLRS
ncbi:glycogen synthase GlgA [Candidatus Vondammii sp. HM_W22]|uniref:glycogen synthase GlgA n=1 Tax=Candidatus Vondammii sp. HM_W22 TaxID=2687299 RepID=UPI002E7B2FA4|nr:glycogen synthase GlgA [Candidatus Vondammii sp. HM_W22]